MGRSPAVALVTSRPTKLLILLYISNLLIPHPDDVANMVVLVLNTLYFKGSWRHQFAPNATKTGPFYVSPKVQKTISFMNVNDKFYYTESTKYDAKILRMPYMVSWHLKLLDWPVGLVVRDPNC